MAVALVLVFPLAEYGQSNVKLRDFINDPHGVMPNYKAGKFIPEARALSTRREPIYRKLKKNDPELIKVFGLLLEWIGLGGKDAFLQMAVRTRDELAKSGKHVKEDPDAKQARDKDVDWMEYNRLKYEVKNVESLHDWTDLNVQHQWELQIVRGIAVGEIVKKKGYIKRSFFC